MEPQISVTPPGPKSLGILDRDSRVVSQSMEREFPFVLERASGVNLWDVDGNRYLDFTAGIAVMNVGWNHPKVISAIEKQAKYLTHGAFLDICSEIPVMFAEKLLEYLPAGDNRVYFSNSGAECVEAAMKLARYHTKRKYFISFYGGFHGRTFGALSLTSSNFIHRRHFGPFLPVIHIPYPDPYRPLGMDSQRCDLDVIKYLEEVVFQREVAPEEVAGIFVEPIQGEGGYVIPPLTFLKHLRNICDEHDILLIADEVQSGCCRTGRFLASEHFGVMADIVCLSKAIGGGLPLGVTVARDEIMSWGPGSHASTFGGNNLSCAAGLAVLEILKDERLDQKAKENGNFLLKGLKELQNAHEIVGNVRGIGLMCGMELVRDRDTKEPARTQRDEIIQNACTEGLTLLPAGQSVIRFCPPLVIEQEDIATGLDILNNAMKEF